MPKAAPTPAPTPTPPMYAASASARRLHASPGRSECTGALAPAAQARPEAHSLRLGLTVCSAVVAQCRTRPAGVLPAPCRRRCTALPHARPTPPTTPPAATKPSSNRGARASTRRVGELHGHVVARVLRIDERVKQRHTHVVRASREGLSKANTTRTPRATDDADGRSSGP